MTLSYDGRVELAIGRVTLKDKGTYSCVATNIVGRNETSATVDVQKSDGVLEDVAEERQNIP